MNCYNIMAILVDSRSKNALRVQELLTKYGCMIKMRLGLHEAGNACSEDGLIILQLCENKEKIEQFKTELNAIDGVNAKYMDMKPE